MKRREFPPSVKFEILQRATKNGRLHCEGCDQDVTGKKVAIDHTIPDALFLDKKRSLTAADGKLLGEKCCHAPKTADDIRQIRKSDRQRNNFAGVTRKRSSFRTNRDGQYKAKIGGGVVPR